jgi:hypothetical protein
MNWKFAPLEKPRCFSDACTDFHPRTQPADEATAPSRIEFGAFATTPFVGLSLSC